MLLHLLDLGHHLGLLRVTLQLVHDRVFVAQAGQLQDQLERHFLRAVDLGQLSHHLELLLLDGQGVRRFVDDDVHVDLGHVVARGVRLIQARVLDLDHLLQGLSGAFVALLGLLLQLLADGHRLVQPHPLQVVFVVGDPHPALFVPELLDSRPDLPVAPLLPVPVSVHQRADFQLGIVLQAADGAAAQVLLIDALEDVRGAAGVHLLLGFPEQVGLAGGQVGVRLDLGAAIRQRAGRELHSPVGQLELFCHLTGVRHRALLVPELPGGQHVQRLGPAVVDLVLQAQHRVHQAVTLAVPGDVAVHQLNRAHRVAVFVHQR